MKAQIRKNQKDWHIYIFWIILGAFALLFIMDAFSGNEFDQLPLVLCLLPLAILQSRPYQITDRDMLYGNGQYSLMGQNADEFPQSATLGDNAVRVEMEASVLLGGINRSVFATADDELRPVMNGIYFDITTN